MFTRPKLPAVHDIFVKSRPLFEGIPGLLMVFLRIPLEHAGVVVQTYALAVSLDDPAWVVEQVVGVDNANFNSLSDSVARRVPAVLSLASDLGSNLTS